MRNNLRTILKYFSDNTNLGKSEAIYIADLLFKDCKNVDSVAIENNLVKRYRHNSKKIKNISNTLSLATNIKELLPLLNKRNSYNLFENINNFNRVYYSVLWESIHN